MSAEQYTAAIAAHQRDREAAGIVRRSGQPARSVQDSDASASRFITLAFLQQGMKDAKARGLVTSSTWLAKQRDARTALLRTLAERKARIKETKLRE